MMYTDKKLEDDSDSDWDDMTTQPVVEHSTVTEDTNANGTKLTHKEESHGKSKEKEEVEAVTANAPKVESQIQTKQFGMSLGVSRTLPKLGHSVPTPPLSHKPRQGRRRQERSVDPPYEFSSLTDESDKYSLSKAVSAPLKSNKYYQTEKVADRTSNPVHKRNSWDEVSELQEDNFPTLIEKTIQIAQQDDICTDPIVLKTTFVEIATDFPPKLFPITKQEALENIYSPPHKTDTFSIQDTNNPQLSSNTERNNTSGGGLEKVTRSLTQLSQQSPFRGTTHMHSSNTIDGIYIFEEMSSDRVEYERDLGDAYMMNLAMRLLREIARCCRSIRLCEITYPASLHQDYTRLNTHIL